MPNIAIVGVGETRYAKRLNRDLGSLMVEAAEAAASDAGFDPRRLDGIIAPSVDYAGVHELARHLGINGDFFCAEALHGGAAVVSAPLVARLAIEAGLAHTLLCVQGIIWGSDRPGNVGLPHAAMRMKASFEIPFGWYPQIVHFAGMARRHMELYGTTEEQLAAVAIACRKHAALCDNAILRAPLALDDYRHASLLADPFRAADCCLVNDGAAAFIMTSVERARDLPNPAVRVLAATQGILRGGEFSSLRPDYLCTGAIHSGPKAFAQAGVRHADI